MKRVEPDIRPNVELHRSPLVGRIILKDGSRYQITDVQNQQFYQQGDYQSLIFFRRINDAGELDG